MMNRPFLKWAGGKTRLLSQLLPLIPDGKILMEPFVGSGSVFANTNFEHHILNDLNNDLYQTLIAVKTMPASLIAKCKDLYFIDGSNTSEFYYSVRDDFNLGIHRGLNRAAQFIYLNRHCFNGMCRYNAKGHFNVPFGKYKTVYFPEREINIFSDKLFDNTSISSTDFEIVMGTAYEQHIVYCDPPYLNKFQTTHLQGFHYTIIIDW